MAANTYECMLLLDSNRISGDVAGAIQQIHTVMERHHAEVLASRQWDERKLAYPIRGQKKGLYYLIYLRSEGKNLAPMERDLALNENILRMLTIKIHAKMAEAMLAMARDEHALVMQSVPEEVGGGGGDGDGERRRGRRPLEEARP